MFKEFTQYCRDNPHGYWFKRKTFGWGWVPVTWQGWAVIGLWLVAVLLFAFTLNENSSPREVAFTFILPLVFLTGLLIRVCYKKGEKPRWQWGIPKKDDQKEN